MEESEAKEFARLWPKFRQDFQSQVKGMDTLEARKQYNLAMECVQEVLELDILAPLEIIL